MNFIFVGQNIIGGECLEAIINGGFLPSLVITRLENGYENYTKNVADKNNIDIIYTSKINADLIVSEKISEIKPDLFICGAWPHRIKSPLLEASKLGWINAHPSYLPFYKGSSPVSSQIMFGEEYAGASIHFMDNGFDSGNILFQEKVLIDSEDNSETLRAKCGVVLGKLLVQSIIKLSEMPSYKGIKQPSEGSYLPPRNNNFLLDTSLNSDTLYNHIRALSPFPCAIFEKNGEKFRIKKAIKTTFSITEKLESSDSLYIPSSDFYLKVLELKL